MFVLHEQSAVKNSLSTYVCYALDGLFWLNLYKEKPKLCSWLYWFQNHGKRWYCYKLFKYIEAIHYASFDTFGAKNGRLYTPQSIFIVSKGIEFRNSLESHCLKEIKTLVAEKRIH